MPKRARGDDEPSLRHQSKRTGPHAQQSSLTQFFSPSRAYAHAVGTSDTSNTNERVERSVKAASREVIDVDALYDVKEASTSTSRDYNQQEVHGVHDSQSVRFKIGYAVARDASPLVFSSLDVDPLTYNIDSQSWATPSIPYSFLAHTFVTLSQTRSRIAIINILTNALRTILVRDQDSLIPALYLLSNTLSPPYVPVELGIGHSLLSQCLQQTSGLSSDAIKRLYNKLGDPGDVAFEAKSNMRTLIPHPPLLVSSLYQSLRKMAQMKGPGTVKDKQKVITKMLVSSSGEETRYLVRTLSQNLRVGAVRTSILAALARAMALTLQSDRATIQDSYYVTPDLLATTGDVSSSKAGVKELQAKIGLIFTRVEALLKRIYVRHPCYDDIVKAFLRNGLDQLQDQVTLEIGIPLHPTLGSPVRSLDEIYGILGDQPFSAEFKYDGQRAQIHGSYDGSGLITVKVFSRHLEDMTVKYPDVVALVKSMFEVSSKPTSFIIDSEIVAIDPTTERLKSFQDLSNRARKAVNLEDIRVLVGVFAFDLVYLNGEALFSHPYRDRRTVLRTNFPPFQTDYLGVARFRHVESCESELGRDAIMKFWERAVEGSCEGLMIKLLDNDDCHIEDLTKKSRQKPLLATYEPDKRTTSWLKLKKDYIEGVGDSFDLVPIGAWHGNGRKAQWWSPILLGVWDLETEMFVAVCKCMSGFTDAFYKDLNNRYSLTGEPNTCSKQALWNCEFGGYQPDVYFRPQEVWEIRGADITVSPTSAAAKGLETNGRGLSIRFPRYIRSRDDKLAEQASTPEFLTRLWKNQSSRGNGGIPEVGEEEESEYL